MTDSTHPRPGARQARPDCPSARLVAGLSLVAMAAAAAVAYGVIHGRLVAPGDAAATATTIAAHIGLFRLEVALWVVIVATDVLVALALWRLFAPVAPALARLMAATRIVYAAALAAGVGFLARAAASSQPLAEIQRFEAIWSAGLILFGIHLMLLGALARRSPGVPRALAWLLVVAGVCYTLTHAHQSLGITLTGAAATIEGLLAIPMTLAELWLAVWLLAGAAPRRAGPEAAPAFSR